MTKASSGRSALILVTGLFVCFAGPSQAAGADSATVSAQSETTAGAPIALDKYTKHGSRHAKKVTHHKSSDVVLKSSADKKDATNDAGSDDGDNSSAVQSSNIPPSVADAHAQLASTDTPTGNAKAMTARANTILQYAPDSPVDMQPAPNTQIVSADQLNDVDRALHESKPPMAESQPPAATIAMASADAPVSATAAGNESSTWDQTSLIGKIFIGFGALLTMASAARMFMA
jgi:hypothetical protein